MRQTEFIITIYLSKVLNFMGFPSLTGPIPQNLEQ